VRDELGLSVAAAASVVSLLLLTGCLSTHPGSSSLAYIDIESFGVDAVRVETIRVFEDDNYRLTAEPSSGQLVFEREATQRDRVLFGRYGEPQFSMGVIVTIEPRRQGGCLVRADAYVIREGSEEKLPRMMRGSYQDLLNRVKASLVKAGGSK
jgi:hypothetical protein